MKKFFVPSAWEKNSETVKFKAVKGNLSAPDQTTKSNNKKAKKKKNKQTKIESKLGHGKGPLAPGKTQQAFPKTLQKVKNGRVGKKKEKQRTQKLALTPALARAAAESIEMNDTLADPGTTSEAPSGPASLEVKFKEQLMGGRFRYLNEQLYTMNSNKAVELFRADSGAFSAYHAGYRHQVEKWPINPLNRIIKMVRRLPKSLEIGDFGCGEGKLAQSLPNKVFSMDLVSCRDDIIACDMAHTPLKSESIDVAVYCLSLMGTNLKEYLLEANRVLKQGGLLYIAEIQSRFENVREFVRALEACGFHLKHKDYSVKVFYFFQFKKVRNVGKVALLPDITLRPCLYRKR